MGVGEMDKASFTRFLVGTLMPAAARCQDGAIAFVCMDWAPHDGSDGEACEDPRSRGIGGRSTNVISQAEVCEA